MATCRLPLVVVLGATGAGKSKLAIELAKMFKGEIISADSMQIYKGLDIITNKVSLEEQQECPHHLISYLEADHPHYNIVDFRDAALPVIDDLLSKRIIPIVVGGTNYYIESVLWNFLIDKKHSSSTNIKVDKVHKVACPETNNYIRKKQNNLSRISDKHSTEIPAGQVHSGADELLVKCESARTVNGKFNTQEILTIAGFPKGAECSQQAPDQRQASSPFQHTSLYSKQEQISHCSHFQLTCSGSLQVMSESLTSTSPIQPHVGSFSNKETANISCTDNIDCLQASAHPLHRSPANGIGISSAHVLPGSAVDVGARSTGKAHCVSDALVENSSLALGVGSSACDEEMVSVETTFVRSGDSAAVENEQVTDIFHVHDLGLSRGVDLANPGLSCDISSDSSVLSCDISSDISGLSCGISSNNPGLLHILSSDIHGLSCDVHGLSCEISDSSGLPQVDEINGTALNPENFRHDSPGLLRCLNSMNPVDLYSHLQRIDPQTASRMHPNNRRKIVRAIQVFYECDRTMSSLLSEQHDGQDNVKSGPLRYQNPCILWVKCQQADLNERLDGRVDEMMARGLVAELENFHKEAARLEAVKRNSSAIGTGYTYTHGILQMIGFKEFDDYLRLSPEERNTDIGQKLLQQGVSDLKYATRRYARQQVRWITNRFCNRPGTNVPPIYSVDSTDLTQWNKTMEEAIEVVRAFIAGEVPTKAPETITPKVDAQMVRNVCDLCGGRIFLHLHEWKDHLKSKKHKFNVKMLATERRTLSQLLSAREEQLKQLADESSSTDDEGSGSAPEDSLCSVTL